MTSRSLRLSNSPETTACRGHTQRQAAMCIADTSALPPLMPD
jgi:hypothetical protein